MIHYHGTPITPRSRLYELAGRHFCVSAAEPRDVKVCHEIGQSVMLDNGAFTFWRRNAIPEWRGVYDWMEPWLDCPTTWAVIPDVIDGDEDANDDLLDAWRDRGLPRGAPVWHLHESFDRLRRLASEYERVCFGSSGLYRDPGSNAWHRRVSEAFDEIADPAGRVPWIHMLRGLRFASGPYLFASADSTLVAQEHAPRPSRRKERWDIRARVDRLDARQPPIRWNRTGRQLEMEEVSV